MYMTCKHAPFVGRRFHGGCLGGSLCSLDEVGLIGYGCAGFFLGNGLFFWGGLEWDIYVCLGVLDGRDIEIGEAVGFFSRIFYVFCAMLWKFQ